MVYPWIDSVTTCGSVDHPQSENTTEYTVYTVYCNIGCCRIIERVSYDIIRILYDIIRILYDIIRILNRSLNLNRFLILIAL